MPKIDYKKSGVNYDLLDPFKLLAQKVASSTAKNLKGGGLREVASSRGESCFLLETKTGYLAHVEEGLGTKNLIADEFSKLTKKTYYDAIAIDTVATIVNDLITLGALPISVAMHLAVGDSKWFADKKKVEALVNGWKRGCDLSGALWSGGETPTLKGIIEPNAALLGGSALGIIEKKSQLIKGDLKNGDRIILLESSGIHANGATLLRKIPNYLKFGEALLKPSIIYAPIIRDCQKANIKLHYTSHITGHGWRKIMRSPKNFSYVIEKIFKPLPIFDFIQKHAGLSDREMYATFNMGAGFAIFAAKKDAPKILQICKKNRIKALDAGYLKTSKTKEVLILPKKLHFTSDTLKVR